MAIKYAILGFLSWRALSGYDLKKLFQDTTFLYWSGNNNQIYRTLLKLDREGLVRSEVEHPKSGPSRKLYTITEQGRAKLRAWISQSPPPPQLRNAFLVQLAWADQLDPDELDALLAAYEEEIHAQLLMCREQRRRDRPNPARSQRETLIWHRISEHWITFYETEQAWVQALRRDLAAEKRTTQ